jgi:hypothetical protein
MSDKYDHMREAWGIDGNPFPADAIHQGPEPYNSEVFRDEHQQFIKKMLYGAVMEHRGFSFLWSKGANEDTGFGKTAMLRHFAKETNRDFGSTVLGEAGMKRDQLLTNPAVAAYASLNTTNVVGIYPILFAATEFFANPAYGPDGRSVIEHARDLIRTKAGLKPQDADGLREALGAARRDLGRTLPPLRADALEAFCGADGDFVDLLAGVSPAARLRNGLAYFDFAVTVLHAASVDHVFVFVDQLEDLATTRTVSNAKRSREIGRLRDIIAEMEPFAGRVYFVFTFHVRAADALNELWRLNRLPSYDPEYRGNEGRVVVLRGIRDVRQARALLVTYLDSKRVDGETGELAPFDETALPPLLARSAGRPGPLLLHAGQVYDRAADAEIPVIDRSVVEDVLGVQGNAARHETARSEEPRDAYAIDDLLK